MLSKTMRICALLFAMAIATCPAWAQDASQNPPASDQAQPAPAGHPKHHMMGGKSVSVTGCLQKGDEANEYSITGEDGKKYGLFSTKTNLSEHVGHKVTVTGRMRKESEAGKESASTEKKETGGESADLTVTKLQMVSTTCP